MISVKRSQEILAMCNGSIDSVIEMLTDDERAEIEEALSVRISTSGKDKLDKRKFDHAVACMIQDVRFKQYTGPHTCTIPPIGQNDNVF
ncbi:MAG: hypothetical protein CMC99_03105 [Flavobacteriales bacterium]|nr:hypothetical protein [Flavobacteriales bacterium]|tara:strand:- start:1423 stop:1689 length:267 start_codon:yes stop_codon:yes gene_type:complete